MRRGVSGRNRAAKACVRAKGATVTHASQAGTRRSAGKGVRDGAAGGGGRRGGPRKTAIKANKAGALRSEAAGRAARRGRLRVIEGSPGAAGSHGFSSAGAGKREREIPPHVRRRHRLFTAFAVIACAAIVALVLKGPVTRLVESRRNLSATQARLAEEEEVTRSLQERRDRDLTDRYVEMEARKMGYVKPGEIPIVVMDAPSEEAGGGGGEEESPSDVAEEVSPPKPGTP